MAGISSVNKHSDFYYVMTHKKNIAILSFAMLVFAAGAATAGVSLAGSIPQWASYLSAGVIAADVLFATLFFAHRLRQEKKRKDPQEGPLPHDAANHVCEFLNPEDLASFTLVCKQWKAAASDQTLWKNFAADWCEENPHVPKAYLAVHQVGRVKCPKPITRPKPRVRDYAFSGNHLVFLEEDPSIIQVWNVGSKIPGEQFALRVTRFMKGQKATAVGYFGEKVYIGLATGDIIIWDLKSDTDMTLKGQFSTPIDDILVTKNRIIVRQMYKYTIWKKKELTQEYSCTSSSMVFAITDDIFCTRTMEHPHNTKNSREALWQNDDIRAMCAFEDKIITGDSRGRIKIWDPKTWKYEEIRAHNTSIEKLCISGTVLISQSQFGTIRMYDLRTKKRLQELTPGEGFKLKGAIAGMIITASSKQFKIWDYRSSS
jgi:hypothetical protein